VALVDGDTAANGIKKVVANWFTHCAADQTAPDCATHVRNDYGKIECFNTTLVTNMYRLRDAASVFAKVGTISSTRVEGVPSDLEEATSARSTHVETSQCLDARRRGSGRGLPSLGDWLEVRCRFYQKTTFNQNIGLWNTKNVETFEGMRDAARHTRKRVRLEEAFDALEESNDARRREAVTRRAALGVQVLLRHRLRPVHRRLEHAERRDLRKNARRGAAPEQESVARKLPTPWKTCSTRVVARRSGELRSACRFANAEKFNQYIGDWDTQNVVTFESMHDAAWDPKTSPSRGSFRRL